MQYGQEVSTTYMGRPPFVGFDGEEAFCTTVPMRDVVETLAAWEGREVFVRVRGIGFTDAYVAKIDCCSYREDGEAYESEHGFHSDMRLFFELASDEAGVFGVFGYAKSLTSSDIDGSVLTCKFRGEPTYTIGLLSEVSRSE